ncbi:hypothetical protein QYF36_020283 [Acer negundo]|nr:hypothetical protein QYF36_020283 [Acer negundo]
MTVQNKLRHVLSNGSQSKANSTENDSEDDQLSDATSFDWDHDFLIEVSSDEEDNGTNSNVQPMRGMSFKSMTDERVRLEVWLFSERNESRINMFLENYHYDN